MTHLVRGIETIATQILASCKKAALGRCSAYDSGVFLYTDKKVDDSFKLAFIFVIRRDHRAQGAIGW